jgi:hypothetical protein
MKIDLMVRNFTDSAVFIYQKWLKGKISLNAQILHHIISIMVDFGLPSDDKLVTNIEEDLDLAEDSNNEVGLYSLAIAMTKSPSKERIQLIIQRLKMHRSDLSISVNKVSYGRDILERLLLIESLVLSKSSLSEIEIIFVKNQLLRIDKELLDDPPEGRTYPKMLWLMLDYEANKDCINKCFSEAYEKIATKDSVLWYDQSLCFNSLVVLNMLKCQDYFSKEFCNKFWQICGPRLDNLAMIYTSQPIANVYYLERNPELFIEFGPYLRLLCYSLDNSVKAQNKQLLKNGSSESTTRSLEQYNEHLVLLNKEKEALVKGIGKAVAKAIMFNADIELFSSGLSRSKVGVAKINIKQPFILSGQTIVFKSDEKVSLAKEKNIYEELKIRGLNKYFASVVSFTTEIIELNNNPYALLLYEHLAEFDELKEILGSTSTVETKISIYKDLLIHLVSLYQKGYSKERVNIQPFWKSIIDEIKSSISLLMVLNPPKFRREIYNIGVESLKILENIQLPSFGNQSLMHGDLNCKNIMIERSNPYQINRYIKFIDYETLTFEGDYFIDLGELIEDVYLSLAFVQNEEIFEKVLIKN